MKPALLVAAAPIILTGCLSGGHSNPLSDISYKFSAIEPEHVCKGAHYHDLGSFRTTKSQMEPGEIDLFYWFGSEASKRTEAALYETRSSFPGILAGIDRTPSVNNSDWVEGAQWGIALKDFGIDDNKSIIMASYESFLGGSHEFSLDRVLAEQGLSPSIFRESIKATDTKHRTQVLQARLSRTGIKSVPAILINDRYVVYPDAYTDYRDAWMAAHYLFESDPALSINCLYDSADD